MKELNMKTYKVIVHNSGRIYWYNEKDQRHCEHGPAIEYADGSKEWWINDKLHREDGPAVEYVDGWKFWYLDGNKYSEQEFIKRTQPVVELTIQDI